MNFKKKLWRLLSVLSTLLLVILPISGCDYSFSAESIHRDQVLTLTHYQITTDYTSDSATEQNKTSNIESGNTSTTEKKQIDETDGYLDKDGSYTSKEDIMNYLIEYGQLPTNFITKKEAKKLGWSGGSLEPYAPGKCIGGDYFGNYEQRLPVVSGRTYHECDIDTLNAKSRGAKRIIYSDDGQIYYTDDHYKSFTLLYGDDVQ
ncbi:MAG: ribonuclease domain-containing protein [Anaerobutyricum soehngenii]